MQSDPSHGPEDPTRTMLTGLKHGYRMTQQEKNEKCRQRRMACPIYPDPQGDKNRTMNTKRKMGNHHTGSAGELIMQYAKGKSSPQDTETRNITVVKEGGEKRREGKEEKERKGKERKGKKKKKKEERRKKRRYGKRYNLSFLLVRHLLENVIKAHGRVEAAHGTRRRVDGRHTCRQRQRLQSRVDGHPVVGPTPRGR